jgi:hypothetical protein
MMGQQDRVEQFKSEISQMGVADPATGRDRMLLILGAVLLIAGPVVCVAGYLSSHSTSSPLAQNDATVTAIIGLSLTIAGGALFVRYSVAQFLRFWLARLSYEQQAQTDRLIAAVQGGSATPATPAADPDRVTA